MTATNTTTIIYKPIPSATVGQPTTPNQRNVVEFRMDPEKRPNFAHINDDYHLLENLLRYAKFCENFNVPVPQMAQSLARAIGIQNSGKYSVLIYDYLLAIPEYPPTVNGRKEALYGEGRFCNMVCYKGQLFGVVVFPSTDNVSFYFTEFSAYTPYVQHLVFSYGNKVLRFCHEKRCLAFDYRPEQQTLDPSKAILLTATLQQRKMNQEVITGAGSPHDSNISDAGVGAEIKVIQLE